MKIYLAGNDSPGHSEVLHRIGYPYRLASHLNLGNGKSRDETLEFAKDGSDWIMDSGLFTFMFGAGKGKLKTYDDYKKYATEYVESMLKCGWKHAVVECWTTRTRMEPPMPDNRSAVVESRGESKTVPVAAIAANPWNYNVQSDAAFTKLAESMRRFGFVEPVVVRKKGVGYEIINGEHRWRAAKLLAMTEIPIVDLGEMDDAKAKQLTIILNELGGAPDEVRLAELLKDIGSSTSFSDLASVMPYSDRELQMYIEAVDFSFDNLSGADINPKDAEGKDTEGNYSFGEPNLPAVKTEGVSGPELRRISFRLSPDEAKALVAGLKKIHADPVVALRTAVEVAVKAAKAAA